MKKILVTDDEPGSRASLRMILDRDYDLVLAENAAQALAALSKQRFDLLLLDVMMPERDGVSLLKEAHELYPELPVVMVSASTNVKPVVESMRSGAVDFVTKPFDVPELRRAVARALETSDLKRRVEVLQGEVERQFPVHGMVGQSASFLALMDDLRRAAETDATVLVTGESGTGKELVARQLHGLSSRREEPFVAVHCGALPETLMESELFGHEKGAFTGADRRKLGRFDLAASGTLFFDEVSEMPLATQVKLLRVLQEREYMRLGGTQTIKTNARIIAATNQNLQEAILDKHFREDLFYRLNVVPLHVPPLRERPDDIPMLVRHFLDSFRNTMAVATEDFTQDSLDLLGLHRWPGNIRELRNVVERIVVLHGRERMITPDHLPREIRERAPAAETVGLNGRTLEEAVNTFERSLVEDALRRAEGVQTRAAELLGTTRRILKYRMDKLGIGSREPLRFEAAV